MELCSAEVTQSAGLSLLVAFVDGYPLTTRGEPMTPSTCLDFLADYLTASASNSRAGTWC
ncbi:MAG: hypothetical protein QOE32_2171 [Pseudonocardiales bacterium]|jgi:hypothetical protein|nr:hypothetical protein [Pseudonocardiales bacterium]MDT7646114.1 hypothetical protein [Pseudonocardiales bacterium]